MAGRVERGGDGHVWFCGTQGYESPAHASGGAVDCNFDHVGSPFCSSRPRARAAFAYQILWRSSAVKSSASIMCW